MSYKPGYRCWVTGFKLSKAANRITRNMPPTYVEFTCGFQEEDTEMQYRSKGWPANNVAPIQPDGKPNLKKITGYLDLYRFDTREAAAKKYNELLQEEKAHIQEARDKLDAMETFLNTTLIPLAKQA